MSRALKALAKELKLPIVVLSQLTRAPNAKIASRSWPICANLAPSSRMPTSFFSSTVPISTRRPARRGPRQDRTHHR